WQGVPLGSFTTAHSAWSLHSPKASQLSASWEVSSVRHSVSTPAQVSAPQASSIGAAEQVPRLPGTSQAAQSAVHALEQHTPSTQNPGALHSAPLAHGAPRDPGAKVLLGSDVTSIGSGCVSPEPGVTPPPAPAVPSSIDSPTSTPLPATPSPNGRFL